eukprot:80514-Amphidinium_carterae.1
MYKLLTTRLPFALLLMQLVRVLDRRRVRLDLVWTPRDKNALADALTDGDFTGFRGGSIQGPPRSTEKHEVSPNCAREALAGGQGEKGLGWCPGPH